MKRKRLAAFAAAAAMFAAMSLPMTASAANGGNYGANIGGTRTTSFNKYLVMHNSAHVPGAAFDFSITAGEAVAETATTSPVFAGVGSPTFMPDDETNTGSKTPGRAVFSNSNTTYPESDVTATEDKPAFSTPDDKTDEKYAKRMMTISFPQQTPFTQPGVYRYIITETGTAAGVTNDPVSTRTLDVYVVDDDSDPSKNLLKIDGYVLYNGTVTAAPSKTDSSAALGTKSTGFTNTYTARNLSFGKEVTGNQGSKDKYFKFTLNITDAAGATLNVKVSEMDTDTTKTDSTKYTKAEMDEANGADDEPDLDGHNIKIDSTGEVTKTYYLRDGQYVTIEGLPQGAKYTVSEDEEDYTSSEGTDKVAVAAVGTPGEEGYVAAKLYDDDPSGTIGTSDVYTGFTNNRQGDIPTGILSTVKGSVIIIAVGAVGVIGAIVFLKKRKSEEE